MLIGWSSPLPASAGEELARLIPGAQILRLAGAGHLPWIDRPGSLARALRSLSDGQDLAPG